MNSDFKKGILEKLVKILENKKLQFTIPEGIKLTKETNLINDLSMDSLEIYEFGFAVEEEYNIKIPNEKIRQFETLGDYMNYLALEESLERR